MEPGLIIASGVDYISATMQYKRPNAVIWYNRCIHLLEAMVKDGNDMYPARRLGYDGFVCGGSFAGAREDGYFCTISGERAQEAFSTVYSGMPHVSRIDVQATFRYDREVTTVARDARDAVIVSNVKLGKARQRNATVIEDLRGGATCYVGSKKGAQFARIYNKETESNEERYKHCWRFEVQLKNALACQTAELCKLSEYTQPQWAASFVRQWLRKRGIFVPYAASAELHALPAINTPASDVETRLQWLRDQVAPSLRRLLKLGLRDTILEALGLSEIEPDE
jgi:DNA relaxase NicK